MEFVASRLPDVVLIRSRSSADARGRLSETFRADQFAAAGLDQPFVQENLSVSHQGTLRGLHYQIRRAQGKLVMVLSGEIYDVAVDLRRSSPTFGRWVAMRLTADPPQLLWIPPGFAHGFYALSEDAQVVYKLTDYYAPEWERTVLWNDPQLAIDWPLIGGQPPALSAKDAAGARLAEAEVFP
jgi:dTDP-4-dehydrorhamnose 3,5-epimerase